MFDIGFSELILFAIVAIIFIGPDRLPGVIRTLVKYYVKTKNTILELQGVVSDELKINEVQKQFNEELNKLKNTEIELRQHIKEIHNEIYELTKYKAKKNDYENSPNDLSINERIVKDEDKNEK